ncbi:hypothetical protein ACH4F6_30640 [Streptomyces sp. NPDC017936]|uniref:hypothetical protein n=1 Tax=Streptomyces sp. NPDC017936 TaxID=3365016 RepID=UPI0037A2E46B
MIRLRGARHALVVVLDLTACAVADRQRAPRYGDLARPRGRRPATERREDIASGRRHDARDARRPLTLLDLA